MSRRKGETTTRQRNRTHPFQVEIVVPDTGLGNAMLIMSRWASAHSHETVRCHRGMRWCFCTPEAADAFAVDFGGRRVDLPVDPVSLHIDRPNARELERRARAARFGIEINTGGREFYGDG